MCNHKVTRDRSCLHCGKSPISGYKFCSKECAIRAKGVKTREQRKAETVKKNTHVCLNCGQEYVNKRHSFVEGVKYCSKSCAYNHMKGERHPKYKASAHVEFCAAYFTACYECGCLFATKTKNKKYCSNKCSVKNYSRSASKDKKDFLSCKECGKEFFVDYGDKRKVYCSKLCCSRYNNRITKKVRRARKKNNNGLIKSVDPLKVFIRDRWECQLCGKRLSKRKRGSHEDDAPELDHIIPLSIGGEHTYRNTQCACRRCNRLKSNRKAGDQLLLLEEVE